MLKSFPNDVFGSVPRFRSKTPPDLVTNSYREGSLQRHEHPELYPTGGDESSHRVQLLAFLRRRFNIVLQHNFLQCEIGVSHSNLRVPIRRVATEDEAKML
jgi:hypothetical protein